MLAQYLGVTFQAVSKWENGAALPDLTLVPAIALFFGVSTDQLFDINLMEVEKQVLRIRDEAVDYRDSDPARCEQLLREGLKKFPGNDVLLNNLLYVMRVPERREETVTLCKSLMEGIKDKAEGQLAVCAKAVRALAEDEPPEEGKRTFYERYGKKVLEQISTWKETGCTPRPSLWQ